MKIKKFLTILFTAFVFTGVMGAMAACSSKDEVKTKATVRFDVNTEFTTNVVKDKEVTIGKRVSQPKAYILDENPDNLQVYGWYTTADCEDQWNFKDDRVQEDMTLYAKWVELYEVNYYVNGKLEKTDMVFNGDYIEEDATIVEGYKYLGTYADDSYATKYDYSQPITGTTNLYIQRSEGIYLSDNVEEGELSSGSLTDCLTSYIGSYSPEMVEVEGWVEERSIITEYATGAKEENCTYVNFGYTPKYGDGFVELSRALDITGSQIIRVYFKNLGGASSICAYFTTMLDAENNIYSLTGGNYSQDFCYPNYTGNDGARINFTEDQMYMSEESEWTYVDFNLYEIYKNGYSIWGTSPFLGSLRIQANYVSQGEDDWSNAFLIKSIEGIPYDVPVEDGENVKGILQGAEAVTEDQLKAVSDAQSANALGVVFPKDRAYVKDVTGGANVYNTEAGLLFHAQNEIVCREKNDANSGFSIAIPDDKYVDLGTYTTFNITLRNYGYASKLLVYVYNDEGIPVKAEFEIGKQMQESKTYSVNLYGKYGMQGRLTAVEVLYTSVGVDNLLLVESISLGEFVPYDTVGINFNDKFNYGFTSTDKVDVSFDGDREGSLFAVSASGATLESAQKTFKATTDGYASATLEYYLPKSSSITAVTVEYKINGVFTTPYKYVLNTENKGKVQVSEPLDFVKNERGFVEALRLTFEGTGEILIKEIRYGVSESGMPYYKTYEQVYVGWADWYSTGTYTYDSVLQASIFTKAQTAGILSASMYIGITQANGHVTVPHTTYNVLLTEKSVVKIVYQNKTNVNTMSFHSGFAKSEDGNPDLDGLPMYEQNNLTIDCNMGEYEWSTLTIELPETYVGYYFGKYVLQFAGPSIAIRAISIENA